MTVEEALGALNAALVEQADAEANVEAAGRQADEAHRLYVSATDRAARAHDAMREALKGYRQALSEAL